jgi:hypothetical protein
MALLAALAWAAGKLNGSPIHGAETTDLTRSVVELGWSRRHQCDALVASVDCVVGASAVPRLAGSGALGLAEVAAAR